MVKRKNELKEAVTENMRGGNGSVIINHLTDAEGLNNKGRLYARMILKPGCSIGYHEHNGELEIYYILKGRAVYDDNGEGNILLNAGDVTFTLSGQGHGIANESGEDTELMALIVFD